MPDFISLINKFFHFNDSHLSNKEKKRGKSNIETRVGNLESQSRIGFHTPATPIRKATILAQNDLRKSFTELQGATTPSPENLQKLTNQLQELGQTENSFFEQSQKINEIFKKLSEKYPKDPFLSQFHDILMADIPIFEAFNKELSEIIATDLPIPDKLDKLAVLYQSETFLNYNNALAQLTFLNEKFNQWSDPKDPTISGGNYYFKLAAQSKLFDNNILMKLDGMYSPSIFFQRPTRQAMFLGQLGNLYKEKSFTSAVQNVKQQVESINVRKKRTEESAKLQQKIQQVADTSFIYKIFHRAEIKQLKKDAVDIFVQNNLYKESSSQTVGKTVNKYFHSLQKELIQSRIKQIEALRKLPHINIDKINTLKEELRGYVAYSEISEPASKNSSLMRQARAIVETPI